MMLTTLKEAAAPVLGLEPGQVSVCITAAGQEDEAPAQESKTPAERTAGCTGDAQGLRPEPSAQAAPILRRGITSPCGARYISQHAELALFLCGFCRWPRNNMAVAAARRTSAAGMVVFVPCL